MDQKIIFYCIDTWSTCRKAKAWLSQHSIDFEYRNLIKNPLFEEEIQGLAKLAGMELSGLINKKSQVFKKLAVTLTDLDDKGIIKLIEDNPRIIVRPILTGDNSIIFGFKEQEYLDFIDTEENPST